MTFGQGSRQPVNPCLPLQAGSTHCWLVCCGNYLEFFCCYVSDVNNFLQISVLLSQRTLPAPVVWEEAVFMDHLSPSWPLTTRADLTRPIGSFFQVIGLRHGDWATELWGTNLGHPMNPRLMLPLWKGVDVAVGKQRKVGENHRAASWTWSVFPAVAFWEISCDQFLGDSLLNMNEELRLSRHLRKDLITLLQMSKTNQKWTIENSYRKT